MLPSMECQQLATIEKMVQKHDEQQRKKQTNKQTNRLLIYIGRSLAIHDLHNYSVSIALAI